MKVRKIVAAIICLLVACLGFAGCEWGNKKYTLDLTSSDSSVGKVVSSPAQTEYEKGQRVTVKALVLNDNYEFDHWEHYDSHSIIYTASGVPEGPTYTFDINENTHLYGVFQRIVSFIYELDGGKVKDTEATTISPVKGIELNDVITLPVLEKEGFDFLGWTIGNDLIEAATYTVRSLPAKRADIVAVARFRESKSVNFNLDGGRVKETNAEAIDPIAAEDVTTGKEIALPELVKTGYDFGGWKLGDRTITEDKYAIKSSDLDADGNHITFTAKWTAKTYELALKIKDGQDEDVWKDINTDGLVLTYDAEIGNLIAFDEAGENAYFWYEDKAFTNAVKATDIWQTHSDDVITFYGRVEDAKKYVIKVLNEEGTKTLFERTVKIAESDTTEYIINERIFKTEELDLLTRKGYDFKGFALGDAEPVMTLTYADSAAGTYVAKFDIKHYDIKFSQNGDSISYEVESDNFDAEHNLAVEDYKTLVKFKVNVNEGYKLVGVYYRIEVDNEIIEDLLMTADADCVYSFNVPANDVIIYVKAKTIYTINYYNGETKVELTEEEAKTYVTEWLQDDYKLDKKFYTLPDLDKNFAGWALTEGVTNAKDALISRDGKVVESFWDDVKEIEKEGRALKLYAVWEAPTEYSNYAYGVVGEAYSIIPKMGLSYSEKFNKNVGFYSYLTYMNETYGSRLEEIKANATSVNKNNQAEIMAYNMLQIFNLSGEKVVEKASQNLHSNLIVMTGTEVETEQLSFNITVRIYADGQEVITNKTSDITKGQIADLTGDIRIEFVMNEA